jgi:hypothetical protein
MEGVGREARQGENLISSFLYLPLFSGPHVGLCHQVQRPKTAGLLYKMMMIIMIVLHGLDHSLFWSHIWSHLLRSDPQYVDL